MDMYKNSSGEQDIRVSFIIPILNAGDYLPRCMEAIHKQKSSRIQFEIIVIDNGSKDKSVEIAKNYGAKAYSAPGKTVAALRNIGAVNAKGKFLAYVDADCIISEDWLKNAIRHFSDSKVAAAGAPTYVEYSKGWVQKYWFLQRQKGQKEEHVKWLPTENLILRKSVFEQIGGFNEALITCEDVDLGYKISRDNVIISDPAIKSIHLGEAKSIRQFYKKERWRGRGNLQGLCAHGIIWDEVPSLLFPIYYLIVFISAFLLFAWSILIKSIEPFMMNLFFVFSPIVLLSIRTTLRSREWRAFLPLCILYLVYASARAVALLPWSKNIR